VLNDDVDVRMSDGRLFHPHGLAAANARSPMVERCVIRVSRARPSDYPVFVKLRKLLF